MMRKWTVMAFAGVAACGGRAAPEPAPAATPGVAVSTAALHAHLGFLAHDLSQGRAPGTPGGRLAAEYIATQYRLLGLEPAGANGTYFQPVALVGMTPRPTMTWGREGSPRSLRYLDDFVAWAERPEATIVSDGEVVFVGYGITAPEWSWDDYKGEVVRGKVLLMLVNDPGLQDSTVFLGRILTYYGRWTYKLEEAARRGAVGAILVHTTESATYPWDVVRNSWSGEQLKLDQPRDPSLEFAGWVTSDVARAGLERAGLQLDSLMAAAGRRDFRPVATNLHVAVQVASRLRRVRSDNVVGRLPGADPQLGRDAVLFTAHWDHLGVGRAVDRDSIYNGAEDNASGVAGMLAAAQTLTQARSRPRRSIVFVATTAEERGLLGAEAYVRAPVVPLDRTAAVLNLDVLNVRGRTKDISALGADRSSLGPVFAAAARAESLVVTTEPDVRGSFFRSDHFPFARAGVPALSLESGLDFVGRPPGWGREQDSIWNVQRYHQPSDEYAPDWDLEGMAQQVRVVVRVALDVAGAAALPRWLPNSEFQRQRR
ncbi:MAG TPA: M20/M25/M40 family metallo-hydrolase [Gemmatimonadales bacterium]